MSPIVAEEPRAMVFRHLHWPTALTAHIGNKSFSGAVANLHRAQGRRARDGEG